MIWLTHPPAYAGGQAGVAVMIERWGIELVEERQTAGGATGGGEGAKAGLGVELGDSDGGPFVD